MSEEENDGHRQEGKKTTTQQLQPKMPHWEMQSKGSSPCWGHSQAVGLQTTYENSLGSSIFLGRDGHDVFVCLFVFSAFAKLLNSVNTYILRSYYMVGPVHVKMNKSPHQMSLHTVQSDESVNSIRHSVRCRGITGITAMRSVGAAGQGKALPGNGPPAYQVPPCIWKAAAQGPTLSGWRQVP